MAIRRTASPPANARTQPSARGPPYSPPAKPAALEPGTAARFAAAMVASVLGYCRPRLACTAAMLARACASVTPGFRRGVEPGRLPALRVRRIHGASETRGPHRDRSGAGARLQPSGGTRPRAACRTFRAIDSSRSLMSISRVLALRRRSGQPVGLVAVAVAKIPVVVAVPSMVVFPPAGIAIPIAIEEALPVMMRRHPPRARISRASPVSRMPPIAVSDYILITVHPDIFGAGTWRPNPNHPRRRRRADSDSDGNLGEREASNQEHQDKQFLFQGHIPPE
jgi:hypothetical protein